MGFDLAELKRAVAAHGRVVRVVIAAIAGSSPREVGAAMLVWPDGQSGTIGGGALEFEAAATARRALHDNQHAPRLTRHPLGPELGQCCGGVVTLLAELHDAESAAKIGESDSIARPVDGSTVAPLSVTRRLRQSRNASTPVQPELVDGWMVEPLHRPTRSLWVWGAGHVGRAIVASFAPLPEYDITWVDTAPDRFPADVAPNVTILPAVDPARLVPHAPAEAEHLIVTYSHALDLELCHQLLGRGFGFAGLIGSKTKWARFRARLQALGHTPERINRITCPMGTPALGKHPQAIAIGVAAELLQKKANKTETSTEFRESTA